MSEKTQIVGTIKVKGCSTELLAFYRALRNLGMNRRDANLIVAGASAWSQDGFADWERDFS